MITARWKTLERKHWQYLVAAGIIASCVTVSTVAGASASLDEGSNSTGKIYTSHAANWAGYDAVLSGVTDAYASWTVPTVSCRGSKKSSAMSEWVGIDNQKDHLVQAGTGADCSSTTAKPIYYSWWESLPAYETPVAYVNAGDVISVDVHYYGGSGRHFGIVLKRNGSTQFTKTVNVSKKPPLAEAECIAEAPQLTRHLVGLPFTNYSQLADFGTTTFTDCTVTGSTTERSQEIGRGSINGVKVTRLNMTDFFRVKAATDLSDGSSFDVTWEHPD